jgi:hypothetical protein
MSQTIEQRRDGWCQPISAESFGGEPSRYDEKYEQLLGEIGKLDSVTGEVCNWARVYEAADVLLRTRSKDMTLLGALCVALLKREGLAGLAAGLSAYRWLIENHSDDMFPRPQRLRGRAGAYTWLTERLARELETAEASPSDLPALEEARAAFEGLDGLLRDQLGELHPRVGPVARKLRELLESVQPAPAPEPEPAPAPRSPPSGACQMGSRALSLGRRRVTVPDSTVPGVPVRIAGNILQLGNTFADLLGGVSVSPDRMPVMRLQPDGRYAVTLALPAGAHIQYKYTLGDGYWNAEHKADGTWNLRELIVPETETVFQDTVLSWAAGDSPILFEVNVPAVTLPSDIIYIQFNVFGWMEPLPMWPLGRNRWAYKLYSPLNILGSFSYRYCRNGQCGSADDAQTAGPAPTGRQAAASVLGQDIQDTVAAWKWFENPEPVTLVGASITPRSSGFMAGVEFQSFYRPNWSYYMPQAFLNTQSIGSNIVVLTPTWTCNTVNPFEIAPVPGEDPLWIDSAIMISQARAQGLNVALFPSLHFPDTAQTFWQNAPRDAQWWQEWFSRYRKFAVHYADLASQAGAQTLILGGEWVLPAMPAGVLSNGAPSNAPDDSELQWKSIIAEARQHFKGQVLWALPYTQAALQAPLNFLKDTDGIYLLWSAALSSNPSATKIDYANEAGRLLDNEVAPLASLLDKPIILAVAYTSAAGAGKGCVPDGRGNCLDWNSLSRPNPDVGAASLSLQTQADIYEALLMTVNLRPWVRGFVSRGYYPPAALQDKSMSAHSKPVADILWYWYPRLLGTIQ